MNNGWIKLHRQLLEWEWYTSPNMVFGLIHLLLICNNTDKKWRGIAIQRGETIKSLETLAKESHLSVRNWRTILNNLKSTGSVTERRHGKFRIMKLEKYNDYQINDTINASLPTGKRQGSDSKQEGKNDKNEKKDIPASPKKPLGKHLHPLAIFTLCRNIRFDNEQQITQHIKRYAKASTDLQAYSTKQIMTALLKAEEMSNGEYDVTLETVGKKISMYKDDSISRKYEQFIAEILRRFEADKDILFTKQSPLLSPH